MPRGRTLKPYFCEYKIKNENGEEHMCGENRAEEFEDNRKNICRTCRVITTRAYRKNKKALTKTTKELEKKEEEIKEIQVKTIKLKSSLEHDVEKTFKYSIEAFLAEEPLIGTRSIIDAIKGTEEDFSANVEENSKQFLELFAENKKLKHQIEALSTNLEVLTKLVNTLVSKNKSIKKNI